MNRRGFLSGLIGAVATVAAEPDLEKLLWEPGKKTIFLPPVPTGNQFIASEMITQQSLEMFRNTLAAEDAFVRKYVRGDWNAPYAEQFLDASRYQAKIGATIHVRKPPMYMRSPLSGTEVRQMQRRFDMALNAHLDVMAQAGHDLIYTRGEVWDQLTLTLSPRSARPSES